MMFKLKSAHHNENFIYYSDQVKVMNLNNLVKFWSAALVMLLLISNALADEFEIKINIDDEISLTTMKDTGYKLFAFKTVKSSAKGTPIIWLVTNNYLGQTVISWEQKYQAYVSKDELLQIGSISSRDMDLGWVMDVDTNGNCKVDPNGPVKTGISVYNEPGGQEWICGINEKVDGTFLPTCAFPLFQDNLVVIQPIEKILLVFAPQDVTQGTEMEQLLAPGILIDLTGAPQNKRTVSYSLSNGWNWEGAWARRVPPMSDLNPLLIEFDEDLLPRNLGPGLGWNWEDLGFEWNWEDLGFEWNWEDLGFEQN